MEAGERSKYIAHAMIHAPSMVSYNKDPETGEITWYDDLSGQGVLSDAKSNLVLTSGSALRCGFSDGTADTGEELAKLLDLPEWRETNDYGRKIAQEWYDTVKRARSLGISRSARLSYAGTGSGDPVEILGKKIQIHQEILRWYDRLDPLELNPPREDIEREIKELRKQLADLKKQQRRR